MGKKKKKKAAPAAKSYPDSPFSHLKGFVVSAAEPAPPSECERGERVDQEKDHSFGAQMEKLGVERLAGTDAEEGEPCSSAANCPAEESAPSHSADEEELFLAAIKGLDVTFKDELTVDEFQRKPTARRMKQLKQGRLQPQATLDLHGCRRDEVATKLQYFFTNARYQGWQILLVITGKGLHSATGEAVLRREAERFLHEKGAAEVVEWGQAPQRYGGEGALAVFLRKRE